jgi:hypothetical protein
MGLHSDDRSDQGCPFPRQKKKKEFLEFPPNPAFAAKTMAQIKPLRANSP